MPRADLDASKCLAILGEMNRLTSHPAGVTEIREQGLALIGKALGASSGVLFLSNGAGSPPSVEASFGNSSEPAFATACERALSRGQPILEEGAAEAPSRVVILLLADPEPLGAMVFERPSLWGVSGRAFVRTASDLLARSLQFERTLGDSRRQGELLVRRNLELEALHDLIVRLNDLGSEQEMLEATLDLVLDRLGLTSGWIFWGETTRGSLGLAACRGVAEDFVRKARETGIGSCLCADVFTTGKLKLARNTTECPRLPELVCSTGFMTHACVPLKFDRGILGVMNIANRPGQLFTPEELSFLETVGRQLCLAVDKARTARAESRRNAESRAFTALARAIGGSLEERHVIAAVADYCRELLSADRCSVFLGDGSSSLMFAYLSGPQQEGLEVGACLDLSALGSRAFPEVLRGRKTIVIQNAFEDPRANAELAARWNIGSAIVVPLMSRDRLQGILQADRSRPSDWSQDEVELANALAGQAAVALENARLYRETREALLKLQQTQYEMMRSERLAAVGTIAASLAHEVRNPLNSINLQLVLLSRRLARLAEPAAEELSTLVENTRREIDRLDGLVEEFLSLSTIDRLSVAETDPNDLAREAVALMQPVAGEHGINVSEDLAAGLGPLPMDRRKMKQVLINLIRNAIEAMTAGDSLKVSTNAGDGGVVIKIADTGSGIDPGLDVFDFFMTTKRGGTGLGLPIARRIVEAHGGTLTYESEPGRGTTFSVTLKAF